MGKGKLPHFVGGEQRNINTSSISCHCSDSLSICPNFFYPKTTIILYIYVCSCVSHFLIHLCLYIDTEIVKSESTLLSTYEQSDLNYWWWNYYPNNWLKSRVIKFFFIQFCFIRRNKELDIKQHQNVDPM